MIHLLFRNTLIQLWHRQHRRQVQLPTFSAIKPLYDLWTFFPQLSRCDVVAPHGHQLPLRRRWHPTTTTQTRFHQLQPPSLAISAQDLMIPLDSLRSRTRHLSSQRSLPPATHSTLAAHQHHRLPTAVATLRPSALHLISSLRTEPMARTSLDLICLRPRVTFSTQSLSPSAIASRCLLSCQEITKDFLPTLLPVLRQRLNQRPTTCFLDRRPVSSLRTRIQDFPLIHQPRSVALSLPLSDFRRLLPTLDRLECQSLFLDLVCPVKIPHPSPISRTSRLTQP